MTPDQITAEQRLLRIPMFPTTRGDYRRIARWHELEAMRNHDWEVEPGSWVRNGKRTVYQRGIASCEKEREYARNMHWAAEMVTFYGPGTWAQLKQRRAGATS